MKKFTAFTSLFGLLSLHAGSALAFQVQVANAPDTNLTLTTSAILSAQHSICLNIYQLSSPQIVNSLINRIQAGVHVEMLVEGQIVGGLPAADQAIEAQLSEAMRAASSQNHLYQMTSKTGAQRRFRYDHAKYAVIDDQSLLIGSENYSPTGNPVTGHIGNRGWEVLIHDKATAQDYKNIFAQDSNPANKDLVDLTLTAAVARLISVPVAPNSGLAGLPSFEASAAARISSPDSSLSGLLAMMGGATRTLDIQQMNFEYDWGTKAAVSPLFEAVVAAARRGVRVRVLLNDEAAFNFGGKPGKPKNTVTIDALNQLASSEKLPLMALTANLKGMGVDYIHNKGALVDGDLTLISSINWVENSVDNNREAAVLITSPGVYGFYQSLFDRDWNVSLGQAAAELE